MRLGLQSAGFDVLVSFDNDPHCIETQNLNPRYFSTAAVLADVDKMLNGGALEMTELQNMSQLEVAEKLGLNYTTAKARVQRARQLLKKRMEEILIVKTDGYGNVILCRDRGHCC